MSKRPRDHRPYIPPVTRLELERTDNKSRWILIVVLLAVGLIAITVGLFSLLNTEPGWVTVEAAPEGVSCAGDFVLQYDFSDAGSAASARSKQLTDVYSKAAENAFLMFSPDVGEEGVGNIYSLNQSINKEIQLEETLYNAFTLTENAGNRMPYLAPVYVEYARIFQSEADVLASGFDPARNPDVMEFIRQITTFASDPSHIHLELLGGTSVKLVVSADYLAFAQENGIDRFVDFGWMKNAFIADYLADTLAEAGYTNGYLTSYDGFTRNLHEKGETFSFNLFDRQNGVIYLPAVMAYSSPASIVFLRDYPMDEMDQWQYYAYEDGAIVTSMIDPSDGMCKSAVPNLVSYSQVKSCGEILVEMIPVFVTDTFSESAVNAMAEENIYSIWFQGTQLHSNSQETSIKLHPESGYTLK